MRLRFPIINKWITKNQRATVMVVVAITKCIPYTVGLPRQAILMARQKCELHAQAPIVADSTKDAA